MLILEGADNLGKTNAAMRLVQIAETYQLNDSEFPVYYSHMSRPNKFFDHHSHFLDMISQYAVQDRFHLGSLVYQQDVMDEAKLRVIEGWLLSVGSMTCVIATDDETWYENHLAATAAEKPEMYRIEKIIEANQKYLSMIGVGAHIRNLEAQPHVDHSYIVNGRNGFVSDAILQHWLHEWFRRLHYVAPNM